tara:strand:+ start:537 stop:728 length:192 start_codon:yes stop_codon:yes gene_type:complete
MKQQGEKEFEVIYNKITSHRVVVYATNEEVARYKAIDGECLPLRKAQVTEKNVVKVVERQEKE